jgi:hypothetical protein
MNLESGEVQMDLVALVLYVVALVVLFGVRPWLCRRRTGSAGCHGISGTPATAAWWGESFASSPL